MVKTENADNVIVADALELNDLKRLFENKTNLLRVSEYCPAQLCEIASKNFLMNDLLESFHHEFYEDDPLNSHVDRFGVTFNTTYTGAKAKKERYYQEIKNTNRQVRAIYQGFLSPFDKFRLELDEVWPHQVGIGNFEGEKMLASIVRVMKRPDTEEISAQPRIEILPSRFANLRAQFVINIYFSLPPYGGELALWQEPLSDKSAKKLTEDKNWQEQLGKPALIKPGLGELIIFNARCPHAITKFSEGDMISIQSFLGLTEQNNLVLWC